MNSEMSFVRQTAFILNSLDLIRAVKLLFLIALIAAMETLCRELSKTAEPIEMQFGVCAGLARGTM